MTVQGIVPMPGLSPGTGEKGSRAPTSMLSSPTLLSAIPSSLLPWGAFWFSWLRSVPQDIRSDEFLGISIKRFLLPSAVPFKLLLSLSPVSQLPKSCLLELI